MNNSSESSSKKILNHSPKFKLWKNEISKSGCTLQSFKPLHVIPKYSGKDVLFGLIEADIQDEQGDALPSIALIRGPAVVIVPEVENRDTGEKHFLMVKQRRSGNGHLSLEFPAGMLDEQVAEPEYVALKELKEETGITVSLNDLFPLMNKPLYSSPGLCDESIWYFGACIKQTSLEIQSLKGRKTGNRDEGEKIQVELISWEEALPQVSSLQVHLGYYLFQNRLKKKG